MVSTTKTQEQMDVELENHGEGALRTRQPIVREVSVPSGLSRVCGAKSMGTGYKDDTMQMEDTHGTGTKNHWRTMTKWLRSWRS